MLPRHLSATWSNCAAPGPLFRKHVGLRKALLLTGGTVFSPVWTKRKPGLAQPHVGGRLVASAAFQPGSCQQWNSGCGPGYTGLPFSEQGLRLAAKAKVSPPSQGRGAAHSRLLLPDLRARHRGVGGVTWEFPGSNQGWECVFPRLFVARASRKPRPTLSAWPLGPAGVWGPGDSPSQG